MKQIMTLITILAFASSIFAQDVSIESGEKIFKAKCSSCHKPDKRLIGPPLKGVAEKYENDWSYLTGFVHNSQELITSGDPRAVKISEEYGGQVMTNFPELTETEVKNIMAYADSFVVVEDPDKIKIRDIQLAQQPPYRPLYFMQNLGTWTFYFLGVFLVISAMIVGTTLADIKSNSKKEF